jgi:hypothetical protein
LDLGFEGEQAQTVDESRRAQVISAFAFDESPAGTEWKPAPPPLPENGTAAVPPREPSQPESPAGAGLLETLRVWQIATAAFAVGAVLLGIQWRSTADDLTARDARITRLQGTISRLNGPDAKGADSLETLKDAAAKLDRIPQPTRSTDLVKDIKDSVTTVRDRFQSTK